MIIDHQHDELTDPDCPSCEVDRLRVEADRYRVERNYLISVCLELAAPLCYATDGSVRSAEFHIREYVHKLQEGDMVPSEVQAMFPGSTPALRPDPDLIDNAEGNARLREKDRRAAVEYLENLDADV